MYKFQNTNLSLSRSMNFDDRCKAYFKLLEKSHIQTLITKDKCKIILDKYILANILIFFARANLTRREYTTKNFFVALYLAHDIQEDINELKDGILKIYFGSKRQYQKTHIQNFLQARFQFFQRINYNGIVSKTICDQLISRAPHWAWQRIRDSSHAGVYYKHFECPLCEIYYS